VGSLGAGGAAGGPGGGGGGGTRPADAVRACPVPFDNAATGCGTGLGCCVAAGVGTARGCAAAGAAAGVGTGLGCAGRLASLDGPPPGPPGRRSLPLVMGFAAICFPLGVAFDTELGGSPGPTWIVLLLYRSSRGTVESLMTFT
jgi:hypothetical protein